MGPGAITPGNLGPDEVVVYSRSFNGARGNHPGKPGCGLYPSHKVRGFNGARGNHPGKLTIDVRLLVRGRVASMGPGAITPGNDLVADTRVAPVLASMGPGAITPGNPGQPRER